MRIVLFPACNADWTVVAQPCWIVCDSKPPFTRVALRDYASASAKAEQMSFEHKKKTARAYAASTARLGNAPQTQAYPKRMLPGCQGWLHTTG